MFLVIAIDQAHEQKNASVKEEGGTVDLTQSPNFLRRWAVAGPELVRMIFKFDVALDASDNADQEILFHDEQSDSIQTTFTQQVKVLVEVMKSICR